MRLSMIGFTEHQFFWILRAQNHVLKNTNQRSSAVCWLKTEKGNGPCPHSFRMSRPSREGLQVCPWRSIEPGKLY